jgi:hypothetical protein
MIMNKVTLNEQDAKHLQQCINDLLIQITTEYQQTQSERRDIATIFAQSDEAFSFLEELELLTVDLRGYASQIQILGWVNNLSSAIAHLQNLRLFSIPTIAQFYFETGQQYPKLKNYLRQLDYIRLLLLEYLQSNIQVEY